MAEQQEQYHKIEKEMEKRKAYMAKLRDDKYSSIKHANESIDYDFNKLDTKEGRDLYSKTLASKQLELRVGDRMDFDKFDEKEKESLAHALGAITLKEIKDLVKGKGGSLDPKDFENLFAEKERDIVQNHYRGVANDYVTKEEHIKPALQYLGLEGKVDETKVTVEHMPHLFATHGYHGRIPEESIPVKLLKPRKKKEETED